MTRTKFIVLISTICFPVCVCLAAAGKSYEVRSSDFTVRLDAAGNIAGCRVGARSLDLPLAGQTRLAGCRTEGDVQVKALWRGGYKFTRNMKDSQGHACRVVDTFRPGKNSIRWEVEIRGEGAPWSVPVETSLQTTNRAVRFWAPWSDPRVSKIGAVADEAQIANGIVPPEAGGNWADPLVARPLSNCTLWYGAPGFSHDNPRIAFCPFQGDLLCVPLVSLLWGADDAGLSLVLSPQDRILDLVLSLTADGGVTFSRMCLRISDKSAVCFAADLVPHEAGWRGGLRWMTRRYPEYFEPVNPLAYDLEGTGAYSCHETEFDVAKMKKMAFRTNWKASFDFPYMGMFIPPVGEQESWKRYGGKTTSIPAMRGYAKNMRDKGFHVLSYFNVTEFGAKVQYPAPQYCRVEGEKLWTNCNDFIYGRLSNAILRVSAGVSSDRLKFYPKTKTGGPYFTWGDGIVLDCGEPVYESFLLDQAKKHIECIPDAAGICIDRMDWLRMYNEERDDGVSWFVDKPARSLVSSWNGLLAKLGPLMHRAGKVVFVNNHDKRLDLLRHVDGIFDEFTYAGAPLNLTALLCVSKPALGWTGNEKNLGTDPDRFFQKYLYLGVYPMAPFPGNDHSLHPSPTVDRFYLDYGPLLDVMRGKRWVLEPDCVEAAGGRAKVNLFEVPGGYVVPVTYGGSNEIVEVVVRNVKGINPDAVCTALHPGEEKPVAVGVAAGAGGAVRLTVPLRRGCAMVKVAVQ